MRIHADFTQPVIVQAADLDWVASPAAGVDRRMLYREGGEVARATSIVRYAPQSRFPRHVHGGGEEILVLEGTFQDEHGDYPAGSYFRNPPGTAHVPASAEGCTIFVRLWQFRRGDDDQVVRRPGETGVLFDDDREQVRIEDWAPDKAMAVENRRGLELLLISGGLQLGDQDLKPHAWGRLPPGMPLDAIVGPAGARVWIKDTPALHPDICILPSQES